MLSRPASAAVLRRRALLACRAMGTSIPRSPAVRRPVSAATYFTIAPRRWKSQIAARGGCMEHYLQLKSSGDIQEDPRQEVCMKMLDDLAQQLEGYSPKMTRVSKAAPSKTPASSSSGGLFGLFGAPKPAAKPAVSAAPAAVLQPASGQKGLYLWGGTGTGKTFMMNMFHDKVKVQHKKRIHFHEWMIDVHSRLHKRQKGSSANTDSTADDLVEQAVSAAPAAVLQPASGQKGLYLWGGTGTGKTFMMNMFHDKVKVQHKKRIHFHEWMIDVHSRLHKRQKGSSANTDSTADDLVEQVAADMMKEAWLWCFDEFQVTHISDAIIMKRIFSVLFELGAVVVATSNRPPKDLYLNGLNRPLFLPFIPMLESFCHVHDIGAEVDYRMCSSRDEEDDRVYITPNGSDEIKILEAKFAKICQGHVRFGVQVETQGRRIAVPRCAENSDVAWFTFKDLCDKPLGAADYLAIGSAFHTIFIADIPRLTMQERDQVRRFITLIDALYESHAKVVCTAALDPISLFQVSAEEKKTSIADEIFAWDRTVSRLMEMQSATYLSHSFRSLSAEQFLGQYKLKCLSDQDFKDLWRRYDQDDNGCLDMQEFRYLLEDLLERQCGHRNVSDELFAVCKDDIHVHGETVTFEEFQRYLADFSTIENIIQEHHVPMSQASFGSERASSLSP